LDFKGLLVFTAGNIEKVLVMFEAQQLSLARDGRNNFPIPQKLYRIGEVVRYTPYSRQTIHNYTIMGLIREAAWTQGGHRLYDESVFTRLSRIARLRRTKTLGQIREMLAARGN
jgi:hypothetical protein